MEAIQPREHGPPSFYMYNGYISRNWYTNLHFMHTGIIIIIIINRSCHLVQLHMVLTAATWLEYVYVSSACYNSSLRHGNS